MASPRRSFLRRCGLVALSGVLAGCGGSDPTPTPTRGTPTPDPDTYQVSAIGADEEYVYAATARDDLYALDPGSGDVGWRHDASGTKSAPAVAEDTVYVGDYGGTVYALDRGSGDQRWSTDLEGFPVQVPVVHEGTLYVGSENYGLYALDAATGEVRWEDEVGVTGVRSGPVVADGAAYFATQQQVHAVDLGSREPLWTADTERDPRGVTRSDDRLYFHASDTLFALSTETGDRQWAFEPREEQSWSQKAMTSPAVDGDRVYVGFSHDEVALLYGVTGDGQEDWEREHPVRAGPPATDGERLYLPGNEGGLYAYDSDGGDQLWAFEEGEESISRSQPALRDGTVYTGNYAGEVFGVNAASGDEQWRTSIRGLV